MLWKYGLKGVRDELALIYRLDPLFDNDYNFIAGFKNTQYKRCAIAQPKLTHLDHPFWLAPMPLYVSQLRGRLKFRAFAELFVDGEYIVTVAGAKIRH
jgi:hypothetical protein